MLAYYYLFLVLAVSWGAVAKRSTARQLFESQDFVVLCPASAGSPMCCRDISAGDVVTAGYMKGSWDGARVQCGTVLPGATSSDW